MNLDEDALIAAADLVGRAGWYAWAAGIFDGESHIGFHQRRAVISVHQASDNGEPQMLKRLQSLFGGTVRFRRQRPGHGECRPLYEWRIGRRDQVEETLEAVWPWLGDVKRQQATEALAKYVGAEGRRASQRNSAQRRWADPEWRKAHPAAVANARRFGAEHPDVGRDPLTGRWKRAS